jgi:hypothetical protein
LRTTLSDESLGLLVHDAKTGRDLTAKPEDSDRVFVDVAKINSKNYYVLGDFTAPGRLPLTGKATVLDAVNLAGGLSHSLEGTFVVLYRTNPTGGRSKSMPINIKQVLLGDDASTNYVLEPGDRLVAQKGPPSDIPAETLPPLSRESASSPVERGQDGPHQNAASDGPTLRDLDRRLSQMEKTLERILERLEDRGR